MNTEDVQTGDGLSRLSHEIAPVEAAIELRDSLDAWLLSVPESAALDLGPRIKFRWPPPSEAALFHVSDTDWKGTHEVEIHNETYLVETAENQFGFFARCPGLWIDVKGTNHATCIQLLQEKSEPFFQRMFSISEVLGLSSRFRGHVHDLAPENLLKVLFCKDRDVANEARIEIEQQASSRLYGLALIEILKSNRHPNRRGAQWCVLDMFEDLPEYCHSSEEVRLAIEAMKNLIWTAEDDIARVAYKAGVVLGGHLPDYQGGSTLIECLKSPSKIGRRSAIHGLFHVVEWVPSLTSEVIDAIRDMAKQEPDPLLRAYAIQMAHDIELCESDHVDEPVFPEEQAS